ncbi:alpha/beta fold hydrolase [Saccharopolyspora karakumensis]|uniref:alpha/beta fold hydrolase n=1 Tax=Saccharopolyspora karakumensis TaxID=2530386 RepID=UPI002E266BFC
MRRMLGALLAVGVTAGAAAPAHAEPALDWQPCAQNAEVECSTVQVPLDWANPQGEQIDIAVVRRPATDPAHRIGTLVHMPGGPGGTGVGPLIAANPFEPDLAARFDVVSFDPRGFGASHPLRCDPALIDQAPDPLPDGPEHFQRLLDHNRRASDDCRARSGAIVDHVDTASVARDIDAFRAALGEQRLNLYGISYGTLTGQMYAEQFPRARPLAGARQRLRPQPGHRRFPAHPGRGRGGLVPRVRAVVRPGHRVRAARRGRRRGLRRALRAGRGR